MTFVSTRTARGITFVVFASVLALCAAGCSRHPERSGASTTVPLMGTYMQVRIEDDRYPPEALKKIIDECLDEARYFDKKFSIFEAESEVNALNIAGTMKVSAELFRILSEAKKIGALTGGKFDITVAPILKAYGFYKDMPEAIRRTIPDGFDGVGLDKVVLGDDGTVTLRDKAWIDLSGIASGFIVDRMAEKIKQKGIESFLIDDGGDIYCGTRPKNGAWRIGIREPGTAKILGTLYLSDMAVVTSGDYEKFISENGTGGAVSHIIDPSAKRAMPKVSSSVTVIAKTCTEADAFATGMMAMGRDEAIKLADTLDGIYAIFAENSKEEKNMRMSDGAKKYLLKR